VSFNSRSEGDWDGLELGTEEACRGGVTTVIDQESMRNKHHIINNIESLNMSLKEFEDLKLSCDVGFLANVGIKNIEEVKRLCEDGKIFGFWSSLDPCLNRNQSYLKSKSHLAKAIEAIS
jgi:dihydroorotase-like cyclic amidohydrolase